MAHHCHTTNNITAAYSLQEEKRGKVYKEEDIFAQVMVEEDLFPEDDGYDVVLNNAVFISPMTTTKPLPSPPVHKLAASTGRRENEGEEEEEHQLAHGQVSTWPAIPRLSLVPQTSNPEHDHQTNHNQLHHHHPDHCDDGDSGAPGADHSHDDDDDAREERGRKMRSPRGDGVDALGMADNEQEHHAPQAKSGPRLPPGAVGYGDIVPSHFSLRKTGGPNSKKLFDDEPRDVPPKARRDTVASGEKPEFMKVVLANRLAPTSPRSPTYETDIGSSSSTISGPHRRGSFTGLGNGDGVNLEATKKWPLGRRRADTDVGRSAAARPRHEPFPRPSLGSSVSSMSRAEQERRVRKESMEYIECPLPPMPESEWWDADNNNNNSNSPADHDRTLYDHIDINGDGDELAPTTPQPDGSVLKALGKDKRTSGSKAPGGLGSSKSAISHVDEERHRKKCIVQ